jgi:hypothetical protein
VAARPATTFVCQFFPPGSGSGSATLDLICISICVSAGGRSLHMLKKARRNWRWRPSQPLLLCVNFALLDPDPDPDPQHWALLVFSICVAAGGCSLHMLKKAWRNWRWRPSQPLLLCVNFALLDPDPDPDPQHWALLVFSICVAAGGCSLHMLKKARRNWRWRVFFYFCVSYFPSWIRIH